MRLAHAARYPEVWLPAAAGRASARIDWSCPLARGLVFYSRWQGALASRDLVQHVMPADVGGGTWTVQPDAPRPAMVHPGGAYVQVYSDVTVVPSGHHPRTIAARVKLSTLSVDQTLFVTRDQFGFNDVASLYVNGSNLPRYANGGVFFGANALSAGRWYLMVGVTEASNSHKLYIDGAVDSSDTGTASSPLQTNAVRVGGSSGGNAPAGTCFDWTAAWNRAMSADEVLWLFSDQNAILEPVR